MEGGALSRVLATVLLSILVVPVTASPALAENPIYCTGNEVKHSVQENRDPDWATIRYCIFGPH